jgi:hypothetical protein
MKGLVKGAPCSERTLRRAKERLGIKASKDGLTGPWMWSLPEDGHSEDGQPPTSQVATFDEQAKNPPSEGVKSDQDGHPSDVATFEGVWDYRHGPHRLPPATEIEAKAEELGLEPDDEEAP